MYDVPALHARITDLQVASSRPKRCNEIKATPNTVHVNKVLLHYCIDRSLSRVSKGRRASGI